MKRSKKDNQTSSKPFLHEDHGRPVTRRDFVARGFMAATSYVLMPGLFEALGGALLTSRQALAADSCPASGVVPGLLPFLVFDCAGGAALPGNWVPTDQTGALLPSYDRLGLGSGSQLTLNNQFGAAMASQALGITNVSQVLQGILQETTPAVQAALKMGVICHSGQSDSRDNQLSALHQVARAGYQGEMIRSGIGTDNSKSGGNSDVPVYEPTLKPLQVTSLTDLSGAVNYGPALRNLPQAQLDALAKATRGLSSTQAQKLRGMRLGDQFAQLVDCGLLRNGSYTGTVSGIDPRQDATFQQVYGLTTTSGVNARDTVRATVVMNVLKGNTGPGVITIGGCDYHDGTQTSGDAKDLEIGREIGRAARAAFMMGKPLVFQVITDGGIFSDQGNRLWRADSNEKSLTVVGVLHPSKAVRMTATQLGYYTSGQGAAGNTIVGNNPQRVAYAVFANYLSLSGKMDLFNGLVPDPLVAGQPEKLLLFG